MHSTSLCSHVNNIYNKLAELQWQLHHPDPHMNTGDVIQIEAPDFDPDIDELLPTTTDQDTNDPVTQGSVPPTLKSAEKVIECRTPAPSQQDIVMYLSDIKSCIHRGAILIRWGAILIRWGTILIRRGARCSSMLWTLCEVSSFPRVCLCWQLLASVLLASVLLPINLILLCIYLTLNLVFPVLIRRGAIHIHRGAIHIHRGAILIRRGAIGAQ